MVWAKHRMYSFVWRSSMCDASPIQTPFCHLTHAVNEWSASTHSFIRSRAVLSVSFVDTMKTQLDRLKQRARQLKIETYALYLAYKDPRVPWYARIFAACVVAYAFSPIDLIPDFIPVIGYLDDLILVPAGIVLALRMIPPAVVAECRERAQEVMRAGKPINRWAAVVIIAIWLLLAALAIAIVVRVVGQ
jgi:uncharacterized membrane protein YkvA (DUF1232 family)